MVVSADTINQFKWFAEAGKRLIPGLVEEAAAPKESAVVDEATKKQFLAFVDRAIPLATRHGAEYLTWLSVEAEGLHHWIAEHDLIAIAGQTFVEDTYTRVLGWALAPPGRPDVALWVQQALLARLGIQHPGDHPMEVILWLSTEDGVPDLVLRGGRLGVVIEAKTCSLEHATPSRDPQTVAYPRALLAEQELETVHTVFLTLDGRAPASPEALPLTYAELALALAAGLRSRDISRDLRAVFAIVISHWLSAALEDGPRELLLQLAQRRFSIDGPTVLQRLADIQALEGAIPRRTRP